MRLGVVVLLLVLVGWVHVRVGLRVLLPGHVVVGVGSPSLLVVGGVVHRVVEGAHGLVVVRVVSRRRHGPGHVGLAIVWMLRVPHAVWTHGSVSLALGGRRHARVVMRRGPSLRLHACVATHHLGLMVIRGLVKILVFINTIWIPSFHHGVLWRNSSALRVRPTRRLTRSLISMVRWAGLGG